MDFFIYYINRVVLLPPELSRRGREQDSNLRMAVALPTELYRPEPEKDLNLRPTACVWHILLLQQHTGSYYTCTAGHKKPWPGLHITCMYQSTHKESFYPLAPRGEVDFNKIH